MRETTTGAGGTVGQWVALALVTIALAIGAGLFLWSAANRPCPWVNHDVAFLAHLGTRVLDGELPYVDFEEINPPGVILLYTALAAVSRFTGSPMLVTLNLFPLALGLLGVGVLWTKFRDRSAYAPFVLLGYGILVLKVNFGNNVVPSAIYVPYDFGQREHLFALVFLPYALARLLGPKDQGRGFLAYAVLVGCIASFKPHWWLLFVPVEWAAALEWRSRIWRSWLCLGVGAVLPYAVLGLYSWDSLRTYVGGVVPLLWAGAYGFYGMALSDFLLSPFHVRLASGVLAFAACWFAVFKLGALPRRALWAMGGVALVAYGLIFQQGKYWSYHAVPTFAAVVCFGAVCVAALFQELGPGKPQRWALVVGVVVGAALIGVAAWDLNVLLRRYMPKGCELASVIAGCEKVMFFAMGVDYAYAPLLLGVRTVGRWPEHFRISQLLVLPAPRQREAALRDYASSVRQSIVEERPDLLLFAPYRQGLPPGVHLHALLASYGALPERGYERIPDEVLATQNPRMAGWVVYRRTVRPRARG